MPHVLTPSLRSCDVSFQRTTPSHKRHNLKEFDAEFNTPSFFWDPVVEVDELNSR